MNTLLATKIGMTQIFQPDGTMQGVTALEIKPCVVVGSRSLERDGYVAARVGFGKARRLNKPDTGNYGKFGKFRRVFEVRMDENAAVAIKPGAELSTDFLQEGAWIDVRGKSSGKGFAGTVKRHNYNRGPTSHGHDHHRQPGSIGSGSKPGRVIKGKTMAGRMGNANVSILNLKIVKFDTEKRVLFVDGSVPGRKGSVVSLRSAVKKGVSNV